VLLALSFGLWIYLGRSREDGLEFLTGYLIELSLSMDNVFVIALIFGYFGVPCGFSIGCFSGASWERLSCAAS
jgi:tellurite resistance protein TerC